MYVDEARRDDMVRQIEDAAALCVRRRAFANPGNAATHNADRAVADFRPRVVGRENRGTGQEDVERLVQFVLRWGRATPVARHDFKRALP